MKRASLFVITGLLLTTSSCLAANTYGYNNPIGHNSITSFMEGILVSIQGLVGILAVVFIVIGGVLYLTAGGNDGRIQTAKNTITAALIGFAIAVAGPSLLKEIQELVLGTGSSTDAIADANSIQDILKNILEFLLTAIGILALMSLIYSGFIYLGSRGDGNQVDKAKKIGFYSILALVIAGSSLMVIQAIINILSI